MSPITTHVLDTAAGRPARGVRVVLEWDAGGEGGRVTLGEGRTDDQGRLGTLLPDDHPLAAGVYHLTFAVGAYARDVGTATFYPEVRVTFRVDDPVQHHHVPLLLSPYGYSTYRGS